jgi:two-component system CheB/CheR fusion protein
VSADQTTHGASPASFEELRALNEKLTALNRQLEEALERQRRAASDLRNVLDSLDIAAVFLDETLRILCFTPAATPYFSLIAADIGRPLADFSLHFTDSALHDDARAVLAGLTPVSREVETTGGGWCLRRLLPYRTADQRVGGVIITLSDISALKCAEAAAHVAKRQAQSANAGKSRFLAAASHDLRQPLQTLSLLQGLLARTVTTDDARQLIARGDEALMAMAGMLNTLLDINQLEAGVIRPEPRDFPIEELLSTLNGEFAYLTKAKGLAWRVMSSRRMVHSDPRLLDQMLRNLLANGLKYTQRGKLLLGCRRRGDRLRIEVRDTGLGIPAGQLRAIFEEFHQINNPNREPSRGLGLGLAIVQRLADLLGASLDVRSWEGRGSVFTIEVPLAKPGAQAAPARPTPEPELAPATAQTGCILIVEDDPPLRESLNLFLRRQGYRTAAVADAEEAFARVEASGLRPDMVIIDHNLPGELTGLDVMARLRGVLGPRVQAVVLTGDISTQTLQAVAAQGYECRTKPLAAGELARLIKSLLSRPQKLGWSTDGAQPAPDGKPVIHLVDDDSQIRGALRDTLQAGGWPVDDYSSAEAFLDAARGLRAPGVLLVDAVLPGMSGLTLLERLRTEGLGLPAIMVTGMGDVRLAVRALHAGAADFIEKPVKDDELFHSIGQAYDLAQDSVRESAHRADAAKRLSALTARQRQILDLMLAGRANKVIANELGISQRTVEAHRAAIMHKTGSKSFSALIRLDLTATARA